MKKRFILTAYLVLVLAALTCNRSVPTATPLAETPIPATRQVETTTANTPTVDITPAVSSEVPVSSDTPTPSTVTPTSGTPECVYDADFVTDITIPDDTELEPGTDFVKTWRMRNSGTCAWEPGTLWSFESGDKMRAPDSVNVPATEPGNTADISVNLTAPAAPGTYTNYWQMRRPVGETFGTRSFVRIIVKVEEITVTPTASSTPTPTSRPGDGPTINYFRSNVEEADPGDTVTLEWETENATSAILYHLLPTGQLGSFWEVSVRGTFEYEIGVAERNHTGFMLFVGDDEGRTARATLSIILRCPDAWFFVPPPDECPANPPIISTAAEQHFEYGVMIWVREQDSIYVLFGDDQSPHWRVYADEWDEGELVEDPTLTPPPGRYQPVRGFGLVWRDEPGVRDRLGWALDPELGFTTAVQRTSRPKYNEFYIRALDGKVWKLWPESSGWEKIP